jgi:beta-galactosidase/beta-glucuronidase
VNGQRVGAHRGGYTGFSIDLTGAVKTGDNVLAVRLNNNWSPTLAPRGGDHIFPGGIYRDVWLVVTHPLHVTWYGTSVTTPDVSAASATVNMKTEVQNQSAAAKDIVLATELLDPSGQSVARFSSTQTIAAGATVTIEQTSPALAQPKLWHPTHPFLYTAVTTVSEGRTAVDEYRTTFGIRSIKWTADQGFFINGEHYYFRGIRFHSRFALSAPSRVHAGLRRTGHSVLVGKLLLDGGRHAQGWQLDGRRLSGPSRA